MDPRSSADLHFCAIGKCWQDTTPSRHPERRKKKGDTDSERETRKEHITHTQKSPLSLTTTHAVLIDPHGGLKVHFR
jgi:hypothetical protein